jgi:hypothetical protein
MNAIYLTKAIKQSTYCYIRHFERIKTIQVLLGGHNNLFSHINNNGIVINHNTLTDLIFEEYILRHYVKRFKYYFNLLRQLTTSVAYWLFHLLLKL